MMVPSPRSVVVDFRPAFEKEYPKQRLRVAVKLKQPAAMWLFLVWGIKVEGIGGCVGSWLK